MCSPKSKSRDEDGNPNKTHLKVFRAEVIKNPQGVGLTKEGMILFALLCGGDYDSTVSIGGYFLKTVINNPSHLLGSSGDRSESCSWFSQMRVW